jgi:hypothetical protein
MSVLGWHLLNVLDDDHVHAILARLELEPKLLLYRCEEVRWRKLRDLAALRRKRCVRKKKMRKRS